MKRFVVVFCIILFTSSLAWGAKGPAGVANGPHNLSGLDPQGKSGRPANSNPTPGPNPSMYNTDEDSLCVFCHTPHGGSLSGALWNRANPSSTWKHYNSATMSTTLKGLSKSRPPGPESMLCLSCHDGSISVNHVINSPNGRVSPIETDQTNNPNTTIVDFFGNPGSRIGGEVGTNSGETGFLTDDHPISFSYTAVEQSTEYQSGAKANQLRSTSAASQSGVRFFGGSDRVECSSCHDPHVDYSGTGDSAYAPFLITPNTGSDLCLACHNK